MINYIPQLLYLLLGMFGLTVAFLNHGKKSPDYDFPIALIAMVIQLSILYWGGFFS